MIIVAGATLASALLAEWDAAALDAAEFGPGKMHLISLPSFGQPRTLILNF